MFTIVTGSMYFAIDFEVKKDIQKRGQVFILKTFVIEDN